MENIYKLMLSFTPNTRIIKNETIMHQLPQMNGRVHSFKESKYMSLEIKENELVKNVTKFRIKGETSQKTNMILNRIPTTNV